MQTRVNINTKKIVFRKNGSIFSFLDLAHEEGRRKNKQKQLSERLSGPILHPKNVPNKFFHCRHICNWICCQESYFAHVFWKLRIRERACEIKSKNYTSTPLCMDEIFLVALFKTLLKHFRFRNITFARITQPNIKMWKEPNLPNDKFIIQLLQHTPVQISTEKCLPNAQLLYSTALVCVRVLVCEREMKRNTEWMHEQNIFYISRVTTHLIWTMEKTMKKSVTNSGCSVLH